MFMSGFSIDLRDYYVCNINSRLIGNIYQNQFTFLTSVTLSDLYVKNSQLELKYEMISFKRNLKFLLKFKRIINFLFLI